MPLPAREPSLDDWYFTVNRIYLDRNFHRDEAAIFAHLVEVMGGLSLLASDKKKSSVNVRDYVPKAVAWWMALCGKIGIRSVAQMIWWKFPNVCPYCERSPHDDEVCQEKKAQGGPDWGRLEDLGNQTRADMPRTLAEWQQMFYRIYPPSDVEHYPPVFARFTEELGELAEAIRVFRIAPGYILSEAADVFAWLMHLQNLIHRKEGWPRNTRGTQLMSAFAENYPNGCKDCGNPVCTCPPILPSTLGRIAHDVFEGRQHFAAGGALLSVEEAMEVFEAGTRVIRVGEKEFSADAELIQQIHQMVTQLVQLALNHQSHSAQQMKALLDALYKLDGMASTQRVTQQSIDNVAEAIAALPSEDRDPVVDYLNNMSAGMFVSAIVMLVQGLAGGH